MNIGCDKSFLSISVVKLNTDSFHCTRVLSYIQSQTAEITFFEKNRNVNLNNPLWFNFYEYPLKSINKKFSLNSIWYDVVLVHSVSYQIVHEKSTILTNIRLWLVQRLYDVRLGCQPTVKIAELELKLPAKMEKRDDGPWKINEAFLGC